MSLQQLVHTLRRGWPVILAGLLLGLVPGVVLSLVMTPSYQATATAMIALPTAKSIPELQQGDVLTQARARTYADVAGSRLVLDKAAKQLGLKDGSELPVVAASEPQTAVITILATTDDPDKAARYANATMKALVATIPQVDGTDSDLLKIVELSPATPPASKAAPQGFLYGALGALVGLCLGFLVAYLRVGRTAGRTRVRTTESRRTGSAARVTSSGPREPGAGDDVVAAEPVPTPDPVPAPEPDVEPVAQAAGPRAAESSPRTTEATLPAPEPGSRTTGARPRTTEAGPRTTGSGRRTTEASPRTTEATPPGAETPAAAEAVAPAVEVAPTAEVPRVAEPRSGSAAPGTTSRASDAEPSPGRRAARAGETPER